MFNGQQELTWTLASSYIKKCSGAEIVIFVVARRKMSTILEKIHLSEMQNYNLFGGWLYSWIDNLHKFYDLAVAQRDVILENLCLEHNSLIVTFPGGADTPDYILHLLGDRHTSSILTFPGGADTPDYFLHLLGGWTHPFICDTLREGGGGGGGWTH